MSKFLGSPHLKLLLRIASTVALLATTVFIWLIFSGNLGPGQGYRLVVLILLGLSYLLIVPSFVLVIANKDKSRVLRLGVAIATAIVFAAIAVMVFGFFQDTLGIYCDGFFGTRQLCVDAAWFWVFFILIFSPVFFVVTLTVIALLGLGLVNEYRESQTDKRSTSRKR
jgi:hypothetical protein